MFGDFIFSILLFTKGIVSGLIFAWIVTQIPFLAGLLGIADKNWAVQMIMTAGDVTSVVFAIISFGKDLKVAFWS
jgi:hypothetical protein